MIFCHFSRILSVVNNVLIILLGVSINGATIGSEVVAAGNQVNKVVLI
jgi:hypothetical protein